MRRGPVKRAALRLLRVTPYTRGEDRMIDAAFWMWLAGVVVGVAGASAGWYPVAGGGLALVLVALAMLWLTV